jgi:FkbM family methyltransferase
MTAPEQDLPLRPDPEAHLVRAGGKHYWMHLPQAGTDYIQKKIADTNEPYEREMLEEMAGRLSPDDLVVDVGANVGNHTLFLAAIAGCRVVALEPNRQLTDAIRASARFNGLDERVQVLCLGAGAASGPASLKADNPSNLGAQRLVLGSGEVEVRPLDHLGLDAPVRAIKIDVEGMELDVLQGAERLIERDRPLLYVECINDVAFRKLQRWLEPRHYMCWETFNATPTHLFMPQERVTVDERLTRLQGKAFHETYRTGLLLTSVRSRLAQVVEQERRAREALAQAQSEAVAATTKLLAAEGELEGWKSRYAELATTAREQLEQLGRLEGRATEQAQRLQEHEAQADEQVQRLRRSEEQTIEQATRLRLYEERISEQAQRLQGYEDRVVVQARQLQAYEDRVVAQTRQLQVHEDHVAQQVRQIQVLDERAARQAGQIQVYEERVVEQAQQLLAREARVEEQVQQLLVHETRAAEMVQRLQAQEELAQEQARQLKALEASGREAQAEIEDRGQRLQQLESRAAEQGRRMARVESERAALKESLRRSNQEQQKFRERAGRLADEQRRLRMLALATQRELNELRQEHERVLGSVRFHVGSALVDARSPIGLAKLPVRLWRAWRRGPSAAPAVSEAPADPAVAALVPLAAEPLLAEEAPVARQGARTVATPPVVEAVTPAVAQSEPVAVASRPASEEQRPEALPGYRLHAPQGVATLRIGALCSDHVDALFGPECRWQRLVPDQALPPLEGLDVLLIEGRQLSAATTSAEVADLWRGYLRQAADAGVATVLWIDGEPQEQPAMLAWAGRVHAVLSDDADAVVLLRRWLGHERVGLWPSAFQPRRLSPFSGDAADVPLVAELHVTDPQSQSRLPDGLWPALARRQLPVAGYTRACHLLFGDLVVSTDDATQRERVVQRWLGDGQANAGRAARALSKAWQDHRAERRLLSLIDLLWPGAVAQREAHVAVVVEIDGVADIEAAARLVAGQGVATSLWCLLPAGTATGSGMIDMVEGVPVRMLSGAVEVATAWPASDITHATVLDMARPWPSGHLALLLAATQWSGAEGAAVLAESGASSHWTCGPGSAEWPAALLDRAAAEPWLRPGPEPLARRRIGARMAQVPEAALAAGTSTGVALGDLQAAVSPQRDAVAGGHLDITPPLSIEPEVWMALLPSSPPGGVTWKASTEGLEFEARVPAERVEYAYLERRFDVRDLKPGQTSLMRLEGSVRGDVRLVQVFYDGQGRKLSHVMQAVDATGPMTVPQGAVTVRLALRFQREASGILRRIELARPRLPARLSVPTAPFLLIAKQYPSYDDLYRFAFVHSRVRGYRERGAAVDVFRLGGDSRGSFREFEGVGVQDGDQDRLRAALAHDAYRTVLVHYMDRHVWNVLREHLDRVRVIIWVHGAEIQPWWRRAGNFPSDGERDTARRGSDQRLAMWREVLAIDSPNLRFVFVSAKQAGEAFSDLGVFPRPDRYRVISNFIDPAVFPYRSKSAEHRRRILSIRPYASNVYANDLTVRAIEILSQHSLFPTLQFTVIGDGPLFEATVEPLRRFANVTLQQRFLTQHEIAKVHREHGIFLVPSRMDSQGVSRDEAMSSGLVPVTTRVAAIPEFVDETCAFLADPEDAQGLADAILALQEDEGRFLRMSETAAAHVRGRSGIEQTVGRELALMRQDEEQASSARVVEEPAVPIAVYGDLNLNIMDGSAIWAASLAETLAGLPGVGVTLLFKARIHRTHVVARLLDRTPMVRFVEPPFTDRNQGLDVAGALGQLLSLDDVRPFRAFVLRGFDLCTAAAAEPRVRGRLWAYLTDIPQSADDLTPQVHARVAAIIEACQFLLCQTPQFESHILAHWPGARGKTILLPPMIPPPGEAVAPSREHSCGFRLCYAGKFAPRWGIRDLFAAFGSLSARLPAQLHVYGDKIHHVPTEPGFRGEIRHLLENTPGVSWHGAVDRDALMRAVSGMDACWAFRDPAFEASTHELSTKVLEYASTGVPVVLARSPVNEALLGADYPLFAREAEHAAELLARLAQDRTFWEAVSQRLRSVADAHAFEAVGQRLVAQGVLH